MVVVKAPTRADVAAVAAAWGLRDATGIDLLALVAARPGGLRHVDTVLAEARMEADDAPITAAHLKAAVLQLGFRAVKAK